ncbi:MAG: hypothetical protein NTX61_16185 [Bacteroidetes bacterium]|nr:hypothetical protein [Bacteroidota bacterium]
MKQQRRIPISETQVILGNRLRNREIAFNFPMTFSLGGIEIFLNGLGKPVKSVVNLQFYTRMIMFSTPEIEEKVRKIEEEAKKRWEAMTEEERDNIRRIGRRFAKKVKSCYPPGAVY